MNLPEDLFYTKTHEWVKKKENNMVRIGITSYAQSQIGDVDYLELPALECIIEADKACAVIESTKAAFDILAPVSGKVTEINKNLEDNPQLVNKDPYGEG
ncbi:MAG: glycine cleavage system protein GcvH [Candidatus Brocadia sp.]|nr:glycine cleavage system protein GcvH [Candidatus Brocadia sp.]MDG6025333.1 glycine cleavage system protein GcvH [Candidatus Brocadia sp.]